MEHKSAIPDSTAVRVALWRAMHVQIDPQPHVFTDEVGFKLVSPSDGWRDRPDMHPQGTRPFRASIVARARFIEDLVEEEVSHGMNQYVMLGAGLDTFVQRRPDIASKMQIFEIDKPSTQEWKRQRLTELGFQIPPWLSFVPVDFESHESWWKKLIAAHFNIAKPAIVTSIGISMYLTMEAIQETLQQMSKLSSGSKFIMTFMLPLELVDREDQVGYQMAIKGAQNSGTPFISFFSPEKMLSLAREFGFKKLEHFSTRSLTEKYFSGRPDGMKPSSGEELLIATT